MATEAAVQASIHNPDTLISCILDMGELLLANGAEVLRVEDTLSRLCAAYGFSRINVFCITSSIVLTVHNAENQIFTQTRRITARETNLQKVDRVNTLSRQLCKSPVSITALQMQIAAIRDCGTCPIWIQCLCYAIISAVFSVFFGGSALDGVAATISGVVMFFTLQFMQKLRINSILQSLLVSAVTALAVVLLVHLGIGHTPELITIGNIMLLIPGIAFTTSLRDIINGDTISGLVGISEAIIKAIAIAIGFATVLVQMGGGL